MIVDQALDLFCPRHQILGWDVIVLVHAPLDAVVAVRAQLFDDLGTGVSSGSTAVCTLNFIVPSG